MKSSLKNAFGISKKVVIKLILTFLTAICEIQCMAEVLEQNLCHTIYLT